MLPDEYLKYIENKVNGLKSEKIIGDIKFIAQYKPFEYVLLKESKLRFYDEDIINKLKNDLSGYYYYTFIISSVNKQSTLLEKNDGKPDYYARLTYCSFGMQNDFQLIDGEDTLHCEIFNFERNFGLAPYNSFTLGFPARKMITKELPKILIYTDRIFDLGTVKFKTEAEDIKNIPNLKFR
jgi:hypothetical protein